MNLRWVWVLLAGSALLILPAIVRTQLFGPPPPDWTRIQKPWSRINDDVNFGALSPDGSLVATGSQAIKLYRASDGKFLRTLCSNERSALQIQFDGSGQLLLVASFRHSRIVRTSNGALLTDVPMTGQGSVAELSPDGTILLTRDYGGLNAYDIPSGKIRYRLDFGLG